MEEIIETNGLGLSYRAGDLGGFIQAVDRIWRDRPALALWSANATKAFKEKFSASRIYPDFASHIELLSELSRRGRAETLKAPKSDHETIDYGTTDHMTTDN